MLNRKDIFKIFQVLDSCYETLKVTRGFSSFDQPLQITAALEILSAEYNNLLEGLSDKGSPFSKTVYRGIEMQELEEKNKECKELIRELIKTTTKLIEMTETLSPSTKGDVCE